MWRVQKVQSLDELDDQIFVGLGNKVGEEPGFESQPETFNRIEIRSILLQYALTLILQEAL